MSSYPITYPVTRGVTYAPSRAVLGTAGASAFAPSPAPSGFHWEFVTDATNGNARVTDQTANNQPVVSLVRN